MLSSNDEKSDSIILCKKNILIIFTFKLQNRINSRLLKNDSKIILIRYLADRVTSFRQLFLYFAKLASFWPNQ